MNIQATREYRFHLTTIPRYSRSGGRSISWSTHLPDPVGVTWQMPALSFTIQPSCVVDPTGLVREVRISTQVPLYSPLEIIASDETVAPDTSR